MSAHCPLCGAPLSDRPQFDFAAAAETALKTGQFLAPGGVAVLLRPKVAEFFAVLAQAYPAPLSSDRILLRIYGSEPPQCDATIHVMAHQLRRAFPASLELVSWKASRGYSLRVAA